MSTCKHCGLEIRLLSYYVHILTAMPLCADRQHEAEPHPFWADAR